MNDIDNKLRNEALDERNLMNEADYLKKKKQVAEFIDTESKKLMIDIEPVLKDPAKYLAKINELKAKIALLESDNNFSLGKRVVELVHEKFELEAKLDSYIKMRDELIEMNKIKEVKLEELTESAGDTVKSLSNHNVLLEAKLAELMKWYENSTNDLLATRGEVFTANEKLKVAVEALEFIADPLFSNVLDGHNKAKEALKEISEGV